MPRRCERCGCCFERDPDGGMCTATTNGVDPCLRTDIRLLDRGDESRDGVGIASGSVSDKGGERR